jgi:signal transduction histidine kinase
LSPGSTHEASLGALAALDALTAAESGIEEGDAPPVVHVCRSAVHTLGTMPPVNHCELFAVDAAAGVLRLKLWCGYAPPQLPFTLPLDQKSIVAHVARSGRLYFTDQTAADPFYCEGPPAMRSELALPLIAGGTVVGVLNLESRDPDAFSPEVISLCESFASGIGATLEGADVTEMLIRAKVALERVFDSSWDAVAILDAQGRIHRLNRALARRLHRPLRELLGQEVFSVLPFAREWLSGARPQAHDEAVAWTTLTDGERGLTYEACLLQLEYPWPAMGDRVLYLRDVTAQREMARRIISVERRAAVGDLLGGVAHEVRSPLTALQAAVDLLQGEQVGGDGRTALDIIVRQVERLKSLMSDLLEFGGPGREPLPAAVPLPALCERALAAWKELPANRGRVVHLSAPEEPLVVGAQPTRIEQVLSNLLDNAAQNSEADTPIEVVLAREGPRARARVCDRGRGLTRETLDRMFEPFFTSRPGGTGLGLALVRSIVDAHGGTLMAWNNDPPPGCTIEFTLPLHGEPRA